jgi:tetratricopeptide (TPR) repeat protein
MISWRYYVDAAQAWDKALELADAWATTYPREPFAFNSLGLASLALGDPQRSIAAVRHAIELDPGFVPPYPNLAGSLIAIDRFDEARAFVRDTRARGIETMGIRRNAYVLAFLGGDAAAMASELATAKTQDAPWPTIWEARTAAAQGRFVAAHELFEDGVRAATEGGLGNLAAQWTAEDAEAHAVIGRCADALRTAEVALQRARDNFTVERVSRTFALCDSAERVAALSRELTERFPEATLTRRVQLPITTAALALRRDEGVRALTALNPVRPYDWAPSTELWAPYLRAHAQIQTRNPRAALAQFQELLTHRGAAPTSPLVALAHLGAARAATETGETAQARQSYEAFLTLWAGADSDVDVVTAARRELAQLR